MNPFMDDTFKTREFVSYKGMTVQIVSAVMGSEDYVIQFRRIVRGTPMIFHETVHKSELSRYEYPS